MQVHNFSLWCDFIHREFLEQKFCALLDSKQVKGATSNPAIFAQSFKTPAYADSIAYAKAQGLRTKALYESLALQDIARAAQILKPLWERNVADGYVSIEIDPLLCDNVAESIQEGMRLYAALNMPNVMIKVPANEAGYEVMHELASHGINVNATLVFTPTQAMQCAKALQDGFKKAHNTKGVALSSVQGVISVFVSRFDRAVDHKLPHSMRARMGIVNAMECYEGIESLQQEHIRTLFASTGVKGNGLCASYYIDGLMLPHSINTAPLESIESFEVSGASETKLLDSKERAKFWSELQAMGIERDEVAQMLLQEGIDSFKQSFEDLLRSF